MTEMITKLMEVSRNTFGQWREHEGVWSMRQFEVLSKLLGNKVVLGDASPELFEVSYTDLNLCVYLMSMFYYSLLINII